MSGNKKIVMQFALFVGIWFALYFNVLASMVEVWGSSETYKHCFFIVPVVLYLFYERRDEFAFIDLRPNFWVLPLLVLVQLVNLFSYLLGINLFAHASAYLSLVLIVWLVFGNSFVYRFAFPLFFLGFTIPFGDELVPLLQDVTAYLTVEMLQLVGIPIYREGLYLYVPNGTFLVAEACAGIRFLIASFALGTLFAYLNYKTRWKIIAFVIASLIVPIIANGIRAFGIVVIGYLSDMEHATGADHLVYGWFFFAFVLVVLFAIGQLGKENTFTELPEGAPTRTVQTMPNTAWLLAIAALVSVGVYTKVFIDSTPPSSTTSLLSEFSTNSNFKAQEHTWKPAMTRPHEEWSGLYKGQAVYIAKYNYDNTEHELVSGLSRYYNIDNYTRRSFAKEDTEKGRINRVELVDILGNQVTLYYWFVVDGQRTAGSIPTKLNQALSKLAGDYGAGTFIAIELNLPADLTESERIEKLEAAIQGLDY